MKISLNWIKQFTDIDLPVDELVIKIGAQIGAVEEVVDLGAKYQKIVAAKVVSCVQHPGAEKLNICKLDDGGITPSVNRDENGHVQVVCGAPNVCQGQVVAWLPPGAVVPSTYGKKDEFVMEPKELRGVVSNGMIASMAELDMSDDHDGIMELDKSIEPGRSFAEIFELDDYIIDIENKMFTHRPDCFGILGVTREIAGIQQKEFASPDWYSLDTEEVSCEVAGPVELNIQNLAGAMVPRLCTVAMSEVKVGPSPLSMQNYLSRVGLKSINNVVDVTNYVMYLTGQPIHAYDADKLARLSGQTSGNVCLESRMSKTGEQLRLLNGKQIEMQDDSTILISSNGTPVGVAGVMGGSDTEVDENTSNILIECATFDMYSVRRTSMKYGLFTDAVTRFNKGQSPLQNIAVLNYAIRLVKENASGKVASTLVDIHEDLPKISAIKTNTKFVNDRLGLQLSGADMAQLLTNVEFGVDENDGNLSVLAPFWRTDIEIPEDLVEEIGRLNGFDQLPSVLPKRAIQPVTTNRFYDLKRQIREELSKLGANEVLTYNFVHGSLLNKVGQELTDSFELSNAISPDVQYYRQSITPSLLEKIHPNVKQGYNEFALFELGKSHVKGQLDKNDSGLPMEFNSLCLVYVADQKQAKKHVGAAYYQARFFIDQLVEQFGVGVSFEPITDQMDRSSVISKIAAPFHPKRSALVKNHDGHVLGVVGEYKTRILKALKLPDFAAGFEVGLGLFDVDKRSSYVPISKYPTIIQDLSLSVQGDVDYAQLHMELVSALNELEEPGMKLSLSPLDIYQKDEKKHYAFRLKAVSYTRTMKNAEINQLLDKLAEHSKQKFNTERL